MPKVSIVVAAYNVAPYLSRCLESLLRQTEASFEIIIIDDGSTDNTPTLADDYALCDPRVKVIHRPNGGLSAARNTGLRAAKGEFICFMDSDDWADLNMVESMLALSELAEAQVAIAGVFVDFHDREDKLIRSERRTLPPHEIRLGVPLASGIYDENLVNLLGYAWNKLYRREWLIGLGFEFEEGLSLVEDIVFNAKVLTKADKVLLLPGAFVHYVQRPRKTLGTTHDDSFLALRMRSINSVDSILERWEVDRSERTERSANASAMALWMALRSAANGPQPKDQLRRMLEQPGVETLVAKASEGPYSDWRGRWAAGTLGRYWCGVALLPMHVSHTARKLKLRFSTRVP